MTKPKKETYEAMKRNYDNMCETIEHYEKKQIKIPEGYYSLKNAYEQAYKILQKEYENNDEESVYYITVDKAEEYNKTNEWYRVFNAVIKSVYFFISEEKNKYLNKLFEYIMKEKIDLPISYYARIFNEYLNIEYDEFTKKVNKLIKDLKQEVKNGMKK